MKDAGHSSNSDSSSSSSTSLTLLEQVKQGDSAGWQRLMDLYRPLVLWWGRGRLAHGEDAEDVAQDVFTTVLTKVGQFDRQGSGCFRAWLKKIHHHKLQEHWKKARRQTDAAGGSEAREALEKLPDKPLDTAAPDDDASERRILLRSALELFRAQFEPNTWEAAIRTAVDGQPAAGVAADLSMSRSAVYTAKSRVLGRLRQEMANLLD